MLINQIIREVFSTPIDPLEPVLKTISDPSHRTILLMMSQLFSLEPEKWCLKPYQKEYDHLPPGPERPYYRRHRYALEKSNRCGVFKNSDRSVEYQSKAGNIFVNVPLESLPFTESDGHFPWTSYNWVLCSEPGSDKESQLARGLWGNAGPPPPWEIIMARHTEWGSSEMGLKHGMLALPKDIWACGEMRIFRHQGQKVYQINLNSSINSTSSLAEMPALREPKIPTYLFRKLMGHHIRVIFERLLEEELGRQDGVSSQRTLEPLVQCVEESVTFESVDTWNAIPRIVGSGQLITTGITEHWGSIDPVHGLLAYYYQEDLDTSDLGEPEPSDVETNNLETASCPSLQSVQDLNKAAKTSGADYYYHLFSSDEETAA